MADRRVDIILSARDEATRAIRGVTGAIQGLKAPLAALGGLAAAVGLVQLGRNLVDGLVDSTKAAMEAERVERTLAQALANSGQSVGAVLPRLKAFASELQRTTGIEDEAILSGQSLLVSLGNLSGQGLERATKAALDLSVRTGSVESAFEAIAKAAAGNSVALRRSIGAFDEGTTKAKTYENGLRRVESALGGQAIAQMQTFEGRLRSVSIAWSELQKTVGRFVAESPAVAELLHTITVEIDKLRLNLEGKDLRKQIDGITTGFLTLADGAVLAARLVGVLGGAIVAFTRDIADGSDKRLFGNIRDFVSAQPGYDRALQQLAKSIESVKAGIEKSGAERETQKIAAGFLQIGHVASTVGDDVRVALDDLANSIKGTGTNVAGLGEEFESLNEKLKQLKLPEFKPDALSQTEALAAALRELDRISPKINTDAAREQIEALRKSLFDLRDKQLRLDVDVPDHKILFEASLVRGGITGMDEAEQAAIDARDTLTALLSLRNVPTVDPTWLEASIQQAYENAKSAAEKFSITLPLDVAGASVDGPGLLAGIETDIHSAVEGFATLQTSAYDLGESLAMLQEIGAENPFALQSEGALQLAEDILAARDAGAQFSESQLQWAINTEAAIGVQARQIAMFRDMQQVAFQTAGAMIASGISGAKGAKEAARGAIAALSAQAVSEAIFQLAKGFAAAASFNYASAALHFKSAALFGAIGVGSGLGARALNSKGGGSVVAAARGFLANGPIRGRDSVPAMLTPGEIVLDEATSQRVAALFKSSGGSNIAGAGGRGLTQDFREFLAHGMPERARGFNSGGIVIPASVFPSASASRVSGVTASPSTRGGGLTTIPVNVADRLLESTRTESVVTVVVEPTGDVLQALFQLARTRVERGSLNVVATTVRESKSRR